ncbi:MAG: stage II sporulation protein M [Clostridia bacterium]|nr:stage II sporulation protein M [Clostridia bacterium]
MKRTTTRRRRQTVTFIRDNRRLFPFVGLFLLGVLCGVLTYVAVAREPSDWGGLLRLNAVESGVLGWLGALFSSVFSSVVLLAALFLLGLWPCGAPFVLLVPLFYGLGLGMTEAYYYAVGGVGILTALLLVMPHGLLVAVVLVMAAVESLRMSTRLCRQLLPSASCGGLWSGFRLYCLRFLLFLLAAVFVGLLDILLRVVFARLLI